MTKGLHAFVILTSLFILSCGKEQKQANDHQNDQGELLPIEIEKQTLYCEEGISCPSYIAKVLVQDNGKQRFCTGTLVAPNVLMTSASCLPRSLRAPNVDCGKSLYFFFHKNEGGVAENAGCKKVLQVSTLAGDSSMVWRDDVAFLQLDKNLYFRRQLAISREGMNNEKTYEQVSIEQVDQYKAIIRRRDCSIVYNSYINPLASNESSPNVVVTGCQFQNGTAGAPLLDGKGRIRAALSQDMNSELRNYIINVSGMVLGQPLKSISHATNFACAPTLYDSYQLDEQECSKPLSMFEVDNHRKTQLDPNNLFTPHLRDVKNEISANEFIEFGVRLIPLEKDHITETYPVCFKNVSSWIKRIRSNSEYYSKIATKRVTFKKMINSDGKVLAFQTPGEKQEIKVYFSPKSLSINGKSYVTLIDAVGRTDYTDLAACP